MSLQAILAALALPPLALLLVAIAAAALPRRRGRVLAALAPALVLAMATPLVAGTLLALAARDARPPADAAPGAVVILGAEAVLDGAETLPGPLTLERLRAGADWHRRTGLPVLVAGGVVRRDAAPVGEAMAASLRRDFGVEPRWVEGGSADTRGNAAESAALLREAGVRSVLLVTHAWHLPRARDAFSRAGIATRPAPVRAVSFPDGRRAPDWLPRADSLGLAWLALRELAGRQAYRWRDGAAP